MSAITFRVMMLCGAAVLAVGGYLVYDRINRGAPPAEAESPAEDPPLALSLPESDREYLWQVEHHGNVLVQVGFAALKQALIAGDSAGLAVPFSPAFEGRVPIKTRDLELDKGFVTVTQRTADGDAFRTLDAGAFAAELMSYRDIFTGPPKVKFSLITLSPSDRNDPDGPWGGECKLEIRGEWGDGKPAEVTLYLDFLTDRPTKEWADGPGGWLRSLTLRKGRVGRAERYLFRDVTKERGIDTFWLQDNWEASHPLTHTGGVYLCDYDRDGRLDLFITERVRGFLYRGIEGGRFREVTSECGLRFPPQGSPLPAAAWIDIDGDGWEDLVHGERVWRNEAGQGFADYTDRCDLRLPPAAVSAVVADYDRDGLLDLYATHPAPGKVDSWLSGKGGGGQTNRLFRNRGDWHFEDVTEASGTGGGDLSTFSAAWLDANNDGWPDLHAINEFGDGVLLVNRGDRTFEPRRLSDRPVDFGSMGVAAGDMDNDGNIDIYIASMYSKAGTRIFSNVREDAYPPDVMARIWTFVKGNELHRNLGGLQFDNLGGDLGVNAAGWAYGPALADLDNDGWLDIHSTAGFISRSRDEPDG